MTAAPPVLRVCVRGGGGTHAGSAPPPPDARRPLPRAAEGTREMAMCNRSAALRGSGRRAAGGGGASRPPVPRQFLHRCRLAGLPSGLPAPHAVCRDGSPCLVFRGSGGPPPGRDLAAGFVVESCRASHFDGRGRRELSGVERRRASMAGGGRGGRGRRSPPGRESRRASSVAGRDRSESPGAAGRTTSPVPGRRPGAVAGGRGCRESPGWTRSSGRRAATWEIAGDLRRPALRVQIAGAGVSPGLVRRLDGVGGWRGAVAVRSSRELTGTGHAVAGVAQRCSRGSRGAVQQWRSRGWQHVRIVAAVQRV